MKSSRTALTLGKPRSSTWSLPCAQREARKGSALLLTLLVVSLLLVLTLAFTTYVRLSLREVENRIVAEEARANAKVALELALAKLQLNMGPDQRVSGAADLLDTGNVENRHWIAAWPTTTEAGGQRWPLVGKGSEVAGAPYPFDHIYTDLREDASDWREESRLDWLVSLRTTTDAAQAHLLNLSADPDAVELVGEGTLGKMEKEDDPRRVWAEKLPLQQNGLVAYFVADQNLKASLSADPEDGLSEGLPFRAASGNHIGEVGTGTDPAGFDNLQNLLSADFNADKLTYLQDTAMLDSLRGPEVSRYFHDVSLQAYGLFTNPQTGGLKRDLTPLLHSEPNQELVTFPPPSGVPGLRPFASNFPVIPDRNHAVLGPSLAALRDWEQTRKLYTGDNRMRADVDFSSPGDSIRLGRSWMADWSEWAARAPKLHPVMTDVRWHYSFSWETVNGRQIIRTHIVPRVVLWNPYNVELEASALLVVMDNSFSKPNYGANWNFYLEPSEVNRLKTSYTGETPNPFANWVGDSFTVNQNAGLRYGISLFPEANLAFVCEPTTFGPGEALIFSAKITDPEETVGVVRLGRYNPDSVGENLLSASERPGEHQFYYADSEGQENDPFFMILVEDPVTLQRSYTNLSPDAFGAINLNQVFSQGIPPDMFWSNDAIYLLKAIPENATLNTLGSLQDVASLSAAGRDYPTLQTWNFLSAGNSSYGYWMNSNRFIGFSDQYAGNLGDLTRFRDDPEKPLPYRWMFGAKMLWFDEGGIEPRDTMRRVHWSPDHIGYNQPLVADWNLRASFINRSPGSPLSIAGGGNWWDQSPAGSWMTQRSPLAPGDPGDSPPPNSEGHFAKYPLGLAADYPGMTSLALFDLPDSEIGTLSIGRFRHAALSPFSWHPSYLVGHSLRTRRSPADASAHPDNDLSQSDWVDSRYTRWDNQVGRHGTFNWGVQTWDENFSSASPLQIGINSVEKSFPGPVTHSSEEEILAYDIAFEVNQNLWDRFFISGVPLNLETGDITWDPTAQEPLWNRRYHFLENSGFSREEVQSELTSSSAEFAFWRSAQFLQNTAAFNVNSTSVEAWVAVLSALRGLERDTLDGSVVGSPGESVFSRTQQPDDAVLSGNAASDLPGGQSGGRILSDAEIRDLAGEIVREVRSRGPFISLADFINRRLTTPEDPSDPLNPSRAGVLDTAIARSGLNLAFENDPVFQSSQNNALEYNRPEYRQLPENVPVTKTWGLPGFLTQGDLLEPLAPALTVRGDTFLIRSYGASLDANGKTRSETYLEAVVRRTPDYVDSGQDPLTPVTDVNESTGALAPGSLNAVNERFGRRFRVISVRELLPDEL